VLKEFLTGNESAAWAARLARAQYIPAYPITPQTEIIETLAEWVSDGLVNTDYCPMDSEHSVMSAAVGASATGVRVFTATSSQGLELMHEMMYIASGLRLPIVMANCSRGLSAPIVLLCDHNDYLGLRDTGWIMINAQNNQEALDSLIMAYKVSENKEVLLPSVVNMDGYVLSYTMEPTIVPEQSKIDRFLPRYRPSHAFFDFDKPIVQGPAVLQSEDYTRFRKQVHKAQLNAKHVIEKVCSDWRRMTDRHYGLIEKHRMEDAEIAIVTQGSISTTARAEVDEMRKKGMKVGLLRLRVMRPLPKEEIRSALKDMRGVAVVDKNLAPGLGGIAHSEIRDCLYDIEEQPIMSSFVMGLGGKAEEMKQFAQIVDMLKKDMKDRKGRVRFV
jgi:pyruvate ferredoxin oxidoreductase alpha subunit